MAALGGPTCPPGFIGANGAWVLPGTRCEWAGRSQCIRSPGLLEGSTANPVAQNSRRPRGAGRTVPPGGPEGESGPSLAPAPAPVCSGGLGLPWLVDASLQPLPTSSRRLIPSVSGSPISYKDTSPWVRLTLIHYNLILTNYVCKDPNSK